MFTIDKKEYRNLQEQVLKNKEDIAAHYAIDRVLAEFGIRVIGVTASYDDLDPNYQGEYGDAFAVGTEPPYVFYIWTRPDPAAGHDTAYWFNVGELAIVGPQGIPGTSVTNAALNDENQLVFTFSDGRVITIPRSLKGEPGGSPSITLTSTGEGVTIKVFSPEGTLEQSALVRNGTDGQSIQGEPGPAGPIVQLQGIITSMSQLDGIDPTTLPPNYAYLLEENGNRYIIGIVADQWTNLGIFAGGTLVTKNGVIQNEWNADTKLDKNTETGARRLYGIGGDGQPTYPTLDYRNNGGIYQILVRRDATGNITIPETPTQNTDAASKKYVDNKYRLYQHKIHFYVDYNDTANVYLTLYDTAQNAKTYINTNGEMSATGYATISGENRPIHLVDINSANNQATVWYLSPQTGQIENTIFDGGDMDITDTVTRVI